jgi:3-hydroxyisobutyrate dehydrogenase-like beta-hydroxyacid dehydrogenase
MGRAIARALASAGPVVVHDISRAAMSAVADIEGIEPVGSVTQLARRCTRVVLSLPTTDVVEGVFEHLLGEWSTTPSAALSGALVLDTSTIGPSSARALAVRAEDAGVTYVDAPVLGRPDRVGTWTIPYGGDPELTDEIAGILDPLVRRVVHVGGSGTGSAVKVLNNQMLAAINAVTAESLLLAAAAGLDPGVFVDTVVDSGAASVSGLFRDIGPRAVAGEFDPVFALGLMRKDNALALELATEHGLDLGVTRAALDLHTGAEDAGYGDRDSIAALLFLESSSGVVARRGTLSSP